jgi:hypothetical protein
MSVCLSKSIGSTVLEEQAARRPSQWPPLLIVDWLSPSRELHQSRGRWAGFLAISVGCLSVPPIRATADGASVRAPGGRNQRGPAARAIARHGARVEGVVARPHERAQVMTRSPTPRCLVSNARAGHPCEPVVKIRTCGKESQNRISHSPRFQCGTACHG